MKVKYVLTLMCISLNTGNSQLYSSDTVLVSYYDYLLVNYFYVCYT